jgi:molybdopterin converting factor small subunit
MKTGSRGTRTGSVHLVLFATAREAVGRPEVDRTIPLDGATVAEVLGALGREFPSLARVLPSCRFARNGRYLDLAKARLHPGDELAVHPPYSGG